VDIDPSSPGSDITSGSSGQWESVSTAGASSNEPTRPSGLPTVLALVTKSFYDSQGRLTQTTDPAGANHYTVYANLQTIRFPSALLDHYVQMSWSPIRPSRRTDCAEALSIMLRDNWA
jgi:hypothetical protein